MAIHSLVGLSVFTPQNTRQESDRLSHVSTLRTRRDWTGLILIEVFPRAYLFVLVVHRSLGFE